MSSSQMRTEETTILEIGWYPHVSGIYGISCGQAIGVQDGNTPLSHFPASSDTDTVSTDWTDTPVHPYCQVEW